MLYTLKDEEQKEKKKRPHSILSELQYKYKFMHTMKASFPIVWLVSQHCYNALLCIWASLFFFPHMNVRGRKNRKCLVLRTALVWLPIHTLTGFVFHVSPLAPVCLLPLAPANSPLKVEENAPLCKTLTLYCTTLSVQRMFAFEKNSPLYLIIYISSMFVLYTGVYSHSDKKLQVILC